MNVNVYIVSSNTYFFLGIQGFFLGKDVVGMEFNFIRLSSLNDSLLQVLSEVNAEIGVLIADECIFNSIYCDGGVKSYFWFLPLLNNGENVISFDGVKHPVSNYDVLSSRESQVFSLIAEGMSDNAISSILSVNVKTVYSHRRSIMIKLKKNRIQLRKATQIIQLSVRASSR
ncbi:helix-turn-helix domain-containing protein (plasmid) [Enterobacter asburiae]|uniref:helix-turn-helix domain-containing protein n=1 Tax=Enterobacter sp. 262D3 TaxID=3077763 RepID=UPI002A822C63|nr:helix-turn-helix transcriptional regulator [Enterobacter sp. 262D3]